MSDSTPAASSWYVDATKKLAESLAKREDDIAKVAHASFVTKRILRFAHKVISEDSKLLRCTASSVGAALYDAAMVGLDPVSPHGYAYLVPRKNGRLSDKRGQEVWEAVFQIGYKGFCRLMRRSKMAERIKAEVVLESELESFVADHATGRIEHPFQAGTDRTAEKDFRAAYAAVWTRADLPNATALVVLDPAQVRARRAVAMTDRFWRMWPREMWRKTAVHALGNGGEVDLSDEFELALAIDLRNGRCDTDDAEADPGARVETAVADIKRQRGTAGVAARIADRFGGEPVVLERPSEPEQQPEATLFDEPPAEQPAAPPSNGNGADHKAAFDEWMRANQLRWRDVQSWVEQRIGRAVKDGAPTPAEWKRLFDIRETYFGAIPF